MTESSRKQDEKLFSVQTVRVPPDMLKRIQHRKVETGESFQKLALRLVAQYLSAESDTSAELEEEDQNRLRTVIEILRRKPKGIYEALQASMKVAVNEFERQQTATKAAGKGDEHQRRKTGTR